MVTLCEQALMAMTHSRWSQAEALAGEARTVFRRAGIQKSYAIPLICAVQARAALHRGDVPAARQELIGAQRLRHLLTYAMPRIATQTRIELARVYLALGDLAGAETLIREIDELLQRRPDMSSLAGEARVLQARLPEERCPSASGESPTCAELRLLPMLATHLTFPQIAATMSLSPNTIKSRRTRSTGNWASPRAPRRSPGPAVITKLQQAVDHAGFRKHPAMSQEPASLFVRLPVIYEGPE